ncbi:hypothetical protein BT96DRAFT_821654 [Gymnopus androsaceus JB14]|uniref:TPR-like protein n=1 Tax=Gymnopus androsaceus JB14 TaxID=1447944 RepID=A0A6A4HJ98_9AGAR|nr:hypothetical protein BT96DRAFT_821654 [Gymnopus androsaceus JB14]
MAQTQPIDFSLVVKLKEQRNALFVETKYKEAVEKYDEAIQVRGDSLMTSILYSNRSACHLNLENFLDAKSDAKKASNFLLLMAIELNPSFAKAYARLAVAQSELQELLLSIGSWGKALKMLPKTNLTPSELRQKADYIARFDATRLSWLKQNSPRMNHDENLQKQLMGEIEDLSWVSCAKKMRPQLVEENDSLSSVRFFILCRVKILTRLPLQAWTLVKAHETFTKGVQAYKEYDFLAVRISNVRFLNIVFPGIGSYVECHRYKLPCIPNTRPSQRFF